MTNVWCELEGRYKNIDDYCDTNGMLEEEIRGYCSKCSINPYTENDDYDAYDNLLRQYDEY